MKKKPIEELIEELRGTCESADLDDYSQEELEQLDQEIRCCDECAWWCDTSEMLINAGGQICEDCLEG